MNGYERVVSVKIFVGHIANPYIHRLLLPGALEAVIGKLEG